MKVQKCLFGLFTPMGFPLSGRTIFEVAMVGAGSHRTSQKHVAFESKYWTGPSLVDFGSRQVY